MDPYQAQGKLFKALMHPARLAILDVLRAGEACVCHLEAALGYRQAYISQHLMVLRDAGLVGDRRNGWNMYYRVIKPQVFITMDSARRVLGKRGKTRIPAVVPSCSCPHCTAGK